MLIIDKKGRKDYYDYLIGIYGIDRNLVLDRRNFTNYVPYDNSKITIIICGWIYEGYYDKKTNKVYYGNELLNFGEIWQPFYTGLNKVKSVYIKSNSYLINDSSYVALEPYPDTKNLNKKEGCPILVQGSYRDQYYHYPQLSLLNFGSCVDAETLFRMLVEYLSQQKTKAEQHPDDRGDIEKLLSKGFDKKESFRGKLTKK